MARPPIRLEDLDGSQDGRRFSPSAGRNRAEILPELRRFLPSAGGSVLEVASGTGEHSVFFAAALPHWTWHPSERDAEALQSIAAWRAHCGLLNLEAPIALDVAERPWPIDRIDAVVAINVMHIAPWATTVALLRGAGEALRLTRGRLLIYGAVFRSDREPVPSNVDFDRRLRETDPTYGVRHLDDIEAAAREAGLSTVAVVGMPNNNTLLAFEA